MDPFPIFILSGNPICFNSTDCLNLVAFNSTHTHTRATDVPLHWVCGSPGRRVAGIVSSSSERLWVSFFPSDPLCLQRSLDRYQEPAVSNQLVTLTIVMISILLLTLLALAIGRERPGTRTHTPRRIE